MATESVKEEGGWLRLKAHGFTFSSPTLKIKLTQNAPSAPTQSAQPAKSESTNSSTPEKSASAAPAPAKKISITCVKGKVVRKVIGVAPKCPAGFKKK